MSGENNKSITPETALATQWPGDKLLTPGVKNKTTKKVGDMTLEEKTVIPILPNHPTATGQ